MINDNLSYFWKLLRITKSLNQGTLSTMEWNDSNSHMIKMNATYLRNYSKVYTPLFDKEVENIQKRLNNVNSSLNGIEINIEEFLKKL